MAKLQSLSVVAFFVLLTTIINGSPVITSLEKKGRQDAVRSLRSSAHGIRQVGAMSKEEEDISLQVMDANIVEDVVQERGLKGKGGKGGKGKKKSGKKKSKKSKGKGGKGKKKSSKSPKKSKGGKGKKCKDKKKKYKSKKSKGGKGKKMKSSKNPKMVRSKGKGGKGGKGKKDDCDAGPTPPVGPEPTQTPTPPPRPEEPTPEPTPSLKFDEPTLSPTTVSPTPEPSSMPSEFIISNCPPLTEREKISDLKLLAQYYGTDLALLDDDSTPQYKAFNWLLNEDPVQVCAKDDMFALERYALATLYFSTDGDNSWTVCSRDESTPCTGSDRFLSGSSVCDWYGIECKYIGETEVGVRRVILNEDDLGLNGPIPPEFWYMHLHEINFDGPQQLSGTIANDINNADLLKILDLDRNQLSGTIPNNLYTLEFLETLDIDYNNFEGTISERIGDLKNLEFLALGVNDWDPAPLLESIGNLANLEFFAYQNSSLTGEIPESYADLNNIIAIDISFNDLEGSIDAIAGYKNIQSYQLGHNNFGGALPKELAKNKDNLELLYLNDNSFTGEIPKDFAKLPNLEVLDLSNNKLEGEIPKDLSKLELLEELLLHGNDLTGEVPAEICDLTANNLRVLSTDCATGSIVCECCTLCK